MSEGGVRAVAEIGGGVVRSKVGRLAFIVAAGVFLIQAIATQGASADGALSAALLAVIGVVVGSYLAWRGQRGERTSPWQMLLLGAFVILAVASAIVLLLQRRRAATSAAPPSAQEVDRLVALDTGGAP